MAKKHILDTDEDTWKLVLAYKINKNMKNNNEAVMSLLKIALAQVDASTSNKEAEA